MTWKEMSAGVAIERSVGGDHGPSEQVNCVRINALTVCAEALAARRAGPTLPVLF